MWILFIVIGMRGPDLMRDCFPGGFGGADIGVEVANCIFCAR